MSRNGYEEVRRAHERELAKGKRLFWDGGDRAIEIIDPASNEFILLSHSFCIERGMNGARNNSTFMQDQEEPFASI